MDKPQCKATTSQGVRCTHEASPSGFCHLHDPSRLEEKRQRAQAVATKRKPLDEVLEVLTSTAAARGWSWEIDSVDEEEFKHAAFFVKRHVDDGQVGKQVTGLCEVALNGGVKVSLQKTSFYGYGISQLHEALGEALGKLPWLKKPKKQSSQTVPAPAPIRLEPVLRRFHQIARQLARRHDDRTTLVIADEYDVQDLLHAILRGLFDDVRAEEGTPSYAGGSGRMDFLLKTEKTVIETKMASAKLRDKTIGEQLIIDIKRYHSHPDCQRLVCFVYDPAGNVKNPEGSKEIYLVSRENLRLRL